MSNFLQVTPFMHVPDLEKALRFFQDTLGFDTLFHSGDYAYVHRECGGFRLLQNCGDEGAPPGNRRFAYYIDVRDVDALYAELKPRLDTLPEGDVYGPVNQAYGQREFMVLAGRKRACIRARDQDGQLRRVSTQRSFRSTAGFPLN